MKMMKGYRPKGKLGSGSRFATVSGGVANQYVKKGYSPKKAKQIGGAVAAKAGRAKYGAKTMKKMAIAGKNKEII